MTCKYETKNSRCGLKGCYAYKHTCYTSDCCKCWEPLTNADFIRAMSEKELARHNVHRTYQCDIDYDYDENPYESWTLVFRTSNGEIFYDKESAIEYELDWLQKPQDEVQHETDIL